MAKTVLALADHEHTLEHMKGWLKEHYRVWGATTDEDAIALIKDGVTPQAVICPCRIAGLSAREFKERLSAFSALKRVPVIVYATEGEQENDAQALETADAVITFPFKGLKLVMTVDQFLDRGMTLNPSSTLS